MTDADHLLLFFHVFAIWQLVRLVWWRSKENGLITAGFGDQNGGEQCMLVTYKELQRCWKSWKQRKCKALAWTAGFGRIPQGVFTGLNRPMSC
ncbi:hypothetical protein Ancab_029648 [Ancistrocladus abbreviatus]